MNTLILSLRTSIRHICLLRLRENFDDATDVSERFDEFEARLLRAAFAGVDEDMILRTAPVASDEKSASPRLTELLTDQLLYARTTPPLAMSPQIPPEHDSQLVVLVSKLASLPQYEIDALWHLLIALQQTPTAPYVATNWWHAATVIEILQRIETNVRAERARQIPKAS